VSTKTGTRFAETAEHRRATFVNWPVVYAGMDADGLDALIAFSAASTFYLSGCFNDEQLYVRDQLSMVVVEREGVPTYVVCNTEEAMARSTGWLQDVRSYVAGFSPIEALTGVLRERGLESARLGLETEFLPIASYRKLAAGLPKATLLQADAVLARARWVKTAAEIERIQHAVVTSDQAVHAAWRRCHPGDTGKQVQIKIIEEFIRRGADKFLLALASGPDTRISHHDASDRKLEAGDLVTCGFAGFWDHYWGDNERMGTVGAATPQQRESYKVLYDALYETIDLIKPGTEVRELYDCPQAAFVRHGDAWRRPHMGHGMPRTRGHEDPMIQPNVRTILEPNMVFVLEQGYRAGSDRYMLSKLVQVTETGHFILDDWWDLKEMFVVE
jgi:Xaa-Pro dipeptidase